MPRRPCQTRKLWPLTVSAAVSQPCVALHLVVVLWQRSGLHSRLARDRDLDDATQTTPSTFAIHDATDVDDATNTKPPSRDRSTSAPLPVVAKVRARTSSPVGFILASIGSASGNTSPVTTNPRQSGPVPMRSQPHSRQEHRSWRRSQRRPDPDPSQRPCERDRRKRECLYPRPQRRQDVSALIGVSHGSCRWGRRTRKPRPTICVVDEGVEGLSECPNQEHHLFASLRRSGSVTQDPKLVCARCQLDLSRSTHFGYAPVFAVPSSSLPLDPYFRLGAHAVRTLRS